MAAVSLKPIHKVLMTFGVRSTSPLITHKWSEKARRAIQEKGLGKKTKEREKRDPIAEAEAATYRTAAGEVGIPGMGFKKALITAAHKDIGIEKTLVRKALFLVTDDPNQVIPIEVDGQPELDEAAVRVGQGSDLRYRPKFPRWRATITLEVDGDLLTDEDILTLVNRAGFGVGICEMRPEKDGDLGRFEVDPTVEATWEEK